MYRFLECEYEFHVFSLITKFIDENSWSSDQVRRPLTVETLSELEPAPVVAYCFDKHLRPTGEAAADTGQLGRAEPRRQRGEGWVRGGLVVGRAGSLELTSGGLSEGWGGGSLVVGRTGSWS